MEQFNKALSFILGLIVVAVFIVVASGKFSIKGFNLAKSSNTGSNTGSNTPSVTPKPTSKPWFSFGAKPTLQPTAHPTIKPISSVSTNGRIYTSSNTAHTIDPNFHSYSGSNTPTSIPNTGVPIVLFPLFGSSLLTGVFMKQKGKKD
jgi:hypothetical protein